jgi:GNAT superfamily N-acetyltransferase
MPSNLERMIRLADEFFATKSDPNQISVNEKIMDQLHRIHPATMTGHDEGDGPVAWMMVIPTTNELMRQFIEKEINEQELLDKTPPGKSYDTIYLCSALVLPEYRNKGLATQLINDAVRKIRSDHPVKSLFYWSFSHEGDKLAAAASHASGLPLYKRPE